MEKGIRPRRLGHVGLAVRDMEAMVGFYCAVLDMDIADRMPYPDGADIIEGVWLRCNADHHSLALFSLREPAAEPPARGLGLHHFAFELGSFDELQAAARHLREQGIPIHAMRQGGPGCQLRVYFRDPEGNLVELYWHLDQVGWDGRSRPYPPIELIDLEEFDVDAFLAWKRGEVVNPPTPST